MDITKELNDFIEKAVKSRKYMPNVATNYRVPLKWIGPELNDQEKTSLETFKKNLTQIFNLVYSKPGNKLSAASIEVYKKRMINLISDYEKYGKDPSAMANWNRPIVVRKRRNANLESEKNGKDSLDQASPSDIPAEQLSSLIKHEEYLANGKAIILTPNKLEPSDLRMLRAYLDYLEARIVPSKEKETT